MTLFAEEIGSISAKREGAVCGFDHQYFRQSSTSQTIVGRGRNGNQRIYPTLTKIPSQFIN
jgi:hypothetical protein